MPEWLDKAKDAAMKAAEEAKKLAEAAKNADYGNMIDKTKQMARQAADEAKKAADNIMKKDQPETKPDVVPTQDNPENMQPPRPAAAPTAQASAQAYPSSQAIDNHKAQILGKVAQVEQLLKEIRSLLG